MKTLNITINNSAVAFLSSSLSPISAVLPIPQYTSHIWYQTRHSGSTWCCSPAPQIGGNGGTRRYSTQGARGNAAHGGATNGADRGALRRH